MSIPGYWMNEQGGELGPAVRKYLSGRQLRGDEVATMRAYLRQWMAGDFRGPGIDELRADVDRIRTHDDLRAWLSRALDYAIDPL
jgi:hypothetical protein